MAQCYRRTCRLSIFLSPLKQNGLETSTVQQTRVLHAMNSERSCQESSDFDSPYICNRNTGRDQLFAGYTRLPACLRHRHHFSSESPTEEMLGLQEEEFHSEADTLLETLHEMMDRLVEQEDIVDADVEYGQGVLTLRLGSYGTYVYNKQTPNRQIWMSSPVSGPVRYDFVDGRWIYRRDDHELWERLTSELSELLEKDVGNV